MMDPGRWPRCPWSLCALMGRKKADCWIPATCDLLCDVDVGGRLAPPLVLPGPAFCPALPREGGARDHVRRLPVVDTDEGRDGGSPDSPGGPVTPETREARRICGSCGSSCGSPSSEAMSVMREEMTLGAPWLPVGTSRGDGKELLGVEERGGLVGVVIAARQACLGGGGGW